MVRILRWGGALAGILLVLGGGIGWLVAGLPGLAGGLLGTALAVVFMGLTALSMVIADAVTRGQPSILVFFGTVLGVFFVKIIVFVILAIWLRTQDWLAPGVFGVTAIVAVLGTLVVDFLALRTSRVPYVDVELPVPPVETEPNEPGASSGVPNP
jgi:hypothetical protein